MLLLGLFVDIYHPFAAFDVCREGCPGGFVRRERGPNCFPFELDEGVELNGKGPTASTGPRQAHQVLAVITIVQDTVMLQEATVAVYSVGASFVRKLPSESPLDASEVLSIVRRLTVTTAMALSRASDSIVALSV
jgi:hypothetical protein